MHVWTIVSGNTAVIASGKPKRRADHSQQDILGAASAQLVHDAQPELGALVLLEPQAEHFLGAIGANAQCNMDRSALG